MFIIDSYTRKQAIEDGVLADVTGLAAPIGFTVPVAMTATVLADCGRWAADEPAGQVGGLLDLLQVLMAAIARGGDGDRIDLTAAARAAYPLRCELQPTVSVIHGGDAGEPVITIHQVGED